MPGKTADERAALDAQNETMLARFAEAGFRHIAPSILQPADLFLDRSGEDIRTRTFVFTDPAGRELCLRPDLTLPTCRYHLERAERPDAEARYCYCGPAFRYQPGGADRMHPQEFVQVGVEWFAAGDREACEADVLALAIGAVEAAGLRGYRVRLGDLALFNALIDSIPMPARWRARLKHQFWRPKAFRALMERLAGRIGETHDPAEPLLEAIDGHGLERAEAVVEEVLEQEGIPLVGGRSVAEIATRLHERASDRREAPLTAAQIALVEQYLAIDGAPAEALGAMRSLGADGSEAFSLAVESLARRFALAGERGLPCADYRFSAEFGRNLEYYTGTVFQIEVRAATGWVPVAGGGRYDGLMGGIGSPVSVPAVGCAIHTERLRAAVEDGNG